MARLIDIVRVGIITTRPGWPRFVGVCVVFGKRCCHRICMPARHFGADVHDSCCLRGKPDLHGGSVKVSHA